MTEPPADDVDAAIAWARGGPAHDGPCLNFEGQDPFAYDKWDSCYLHVEASGRHVRLLADEVDRLTRDLEGLRAGLKFCQEGADETGRIAERAERELAKAQGKVARVEAVREKYRQNMERLAGSITLAYCDPYQVNQTAFRDLDRALSGGPS